jgi:hypothetical protein
VLLQARILALAGLRLFIDFFYNQINEPRAIQPRGFFVNLKLSQILLSKK